MSELANCPFCGSPAELEHGSDHHGEWFNLGCSRHWGKNPDDTCIAGRIWYTETEKTEAEAIAAWNRRQAISEEALAEFMALTIYKMSWSSLSESAKNVWRKDAQAIIAHLTGKAGT